MTLLELSFASGEESLSVRRFTVDESLMDPFRVSIVARSPLDDLDLGSIVGRPARFRIVSGLLFALEGARLWTGVCSAMDQTRVEPTGLSTYELTIVPTLWLLTQRRNNRLFQHVAIPDIVARVLAEWGIEPVWRIRRDRYPKLELRVQYGETDHDFVRRLLEEAGITLSFVAHAERGSELVLDDEPQAAELRAGLPLPFLDSPGQAAAGEKEYVTAVRFGQDVKPGRVTIRDFDFRRPRLTLESQAPAAAGEEARYEQYRYEPSAFLRELPPEAALTTATPVADDRGVARFEDAHGTAQARRDLEGIRGPYRHLSFQTNALDLTPGRIFSMIGHPRRELAVDRRLLVVSMRLEGAPGEDWHLGGKALLASDPYRPPRSTPRPRIQGTQSALVVGPPGEEIYTDEIGRVRVQFHWDREGKRDPLSSIWMRVSQGWAGSGYGVFSVPRVGHEVLVDFLDGDPDSPIVVGRVFNAVAQVPHALPANKTVSTWRSESSPGGGGFNEIRFEDAAGREMIFEHAQRDRNTIVRNDERLAVGGTSTRLVQDHDATVVGGDRAHVVALNEVRATGLSRTEATGGNVNAAVGGDEAHLVGGRFSVTMGRGLSRRLADGIGKILAGPLAPSLHASVTSVLGSLPWAALGGAQGGSMTTGPLTALRADAHALFQDVLGLVRGFTADPGPTPTTLEMTDRKIRLSTGESAIVLDGPNIDIFADGNITLHARGSAAVLAGAEAAVSAGGKLLVHARGGDLTLQGGPMLHLNPLEHRPDRPDEEAELEVKPRILPDELCPECGGPMAEGPDGSAVCLTVVRSAARTDEEGEGC
jgi:type VI secretion system secreted protein VgrG